MKEPPLLEGLKLANIFTDRRKVPLLSPQGKSAIALIAGKGPIGSSIHHQKTENDGMFPCLNLLVLGSYVKLLLGCELWLHLVKLVII